MSAPKDDKVGYGRPPSWTKWRKGESGNRENKNLRRTPNTVDLMDRLFMAPVKINVNGKKKVPTLAAIILQLWSKEIGGDRRALEVRMKYEAFARENAPTQVEMIFVEGEYTRALATQTRSGGVSNG